MAMEKLCEDCPPADYPTDKTRCDPCPRRFLTLEEQSVMDRALRRSVKVRSGETLKIITEAV